MKEKHATMNAAVRRIKRMTTILRMARCLKLKDTVGGSKAEQKAIRCLMAERHRRESGVYATKD
jgi:hypothetical protein